MEENNYGQTPIVKENNTLGIVGLVTGIIGLILAICCPPVGLVLGLIALICGFIAKGKGQKFALAGIILGIISLIMAVAIWAGAAAMGTLDWESIIEKWLEGLEQ